MSEHELLKDFCGTGHVVSRMDYSNFLGVNRKSYTFFLAKIRIKIARNSLE